MYPFISTLCATSRDDFNFKETLTDLQIDHQNLLVIRLTHVPDEFQRQKARMKSHLKRKYSNT